MKMTFDKFLLIFCIVFVVGSGFLMVRFSSITDKCSERGGTMIQTPNGWMCGKVERI